MPPTNLEHELAVSPGARHHASSADDSGAVQSPEVRSFDALDSRQRTDALHGCSEALLKVLGRAREQRGDSSLQQ